MSLLFLGKEGDPYSADAALTATQLFDDVVVCNTGKDMPLSQEALDWSGDWIVSYLCQIVVPESLLVKAAKGAINFHPGPPEYPGIGCTNFAVYNEETEFGVTCHHMAPKVDTGAVISVKRFPLLPCDSVLSLTKRCYAHMIELYNDVIVRMHRGEPLPVSDEVWRRKPYTRRELHEMYRIELDMDEAEIAKRIRAATYPDMPGPYVVIQGKRFILEGSKPVPE